MDPLAVRFIRQRQNQTGNGQRATTGISEAEQRRKQYQAGVEGHRHRVPRSGSPGSNTEITNSRMNNAQKCQPGQEQDFAMCVGKCAAYSSSSSSSPLLSLVTSTSEISHPPVHTYTTYIWQRGRQNRKTGYVRKIQHLHEEREEEKKKFTPRLCSIGSTVWEQKKTHLSTKAHIP